MRRLPGRSFLSKAGTFAASSFTSGTPLPSAVVTSALARDRIRAVYQSPNADSMIDAYEPIDGAALVLAWFRKHPRREIVENGEGLALSRSEAED